jgi:hypothetical protein
MEEEDTVRVLLADPLRRPHVTVTMMGGTENSKMSGPARRRRDHPRQRAREGRVVNQTV